VKECGCAYPVGVLSLTSVQEGPEVLESTRRVDAIVLDKTGIVTNGKRL
jgi:high-affinity K+ transport system ATPase subunit B